MPVYISIFSLCEHDWFLFIYSFTYFLHKVTNVHLQNWQVRSFYAAKRVWKIIKHDNT